MDTRTNPCILRLDLARQALRKHGASALLVPSSDPHLSEYLPARWQAREWLCGFTGSMATLVVTPTEAALFADSRYWTQAEAELRGSAVSLQKIASGAGTEHHQWLAAHVGASGTVLVDGQVLSLAAEKSLRAALHEAGASLRTDLDLMDEIWTDRAALPEAPVFEHRAPHASVGRAAKLAQVRTTMHVAGCSHHFISSVDDIAWLLNLRGTDVNYNPVFIAHLMLSQEQCILYLPENKLSSDLRAALARDGVAAAPYVLAGAALAALPNGSRILLDPRRMTFGLRQQLGPQTVVVEGINPSTLLKSRKNDVEAQFVRQTMEQDGAAMCEFYAWFDSRLGRERLTELTVAEKLSAARAARPGFKSLSFGVIAGFNANGALPHYRATQSAHAVIEGDGLLLIDSGGQYLGGTTDVTRTWAIGAVGERHRRGYTAVLKGTIALSRSLFPQGTLSPFLDSIARAPLWAQGLDYGHGTGHGVGYFLNVHEGPQSISRAIPEPQHAMQPGMITSIEPGLYREGEWGVRIENLVLNVPAPTVEQDAFGAMLAFETLTLCPIDTTCIERSMLSLDEHDWLNRYHASVRERLRPLVSGPALEWLMRRTEPY